jgi:hypothetical protein
MLRRIKGQSTAEYAVVIGLVIAAAVAMQVYVKRGIQGKVKDAVDYTDTSDTVTGKTAQYEPYYATQDLTSTRAGATTSETLAKGAITRSIDGEEVSTRTGTSKIEAAP